LTFVVVLKTLWHYRASVRLDFETEAKILRPRPECQRVKAHRS